MASNRKYQNISIQPQKLPRTSKAVFELPREDLSEAELHGKSTSDRTKRRVAHEAWFPLPVINKPIAPSRQVVAQPKQKKKNVIMKRSFSRIKPCQVRQINETVVLNSGAIHSKSSSSGIDNRVKANKRKLEDFDYSELMKKKQKKSYVDKSKNKDAKKEKKSCPRKGRYIEICS
ncbi:uncharacterized protein LOC113548487 [Rhopalosiphum maidis]|uniref:uncharacterized protein LOC113548487 n=1 Tax=Rhopalosiphum maidis TaxID=43146 RepID=UPI000F00613E|nr:uncharacterized protein LOC113548487 [Rhopalosiphum maidis]